MVLLCTPVRSLLSTDPDPCDDLVAATVSFMISNCGFSLYCVRMETVLNKSVTWLSCRDTLLIAMV